MRNKKNTIGEHETALPFRPISKRVIGWQIFYCVLAGLLLTLAHLVFQYFAKREQALDAMRMATFTHSSSISLLIRRGDWGGVQGQLDDMAAFPRLAQVTLRLKDGRTLRSSGERPSYTFAFLDRFLSWSVPIEVHKEEIEVLGSLQFFADRQLIRTELGAETLRFLALQMLAWLSLALLMGRLHERLVGRHLSHLARQLGQLHPASLAHALALKRRSTGFHDEFDQLCDAFNQLGKRLSSYIQAHQVLELALRTHQSSLAQVVAERTSSLERQRQFDGFIIAILSRFMNLPPEQADEAVDHAMAAFCEFFDAPRCLLFTLDESNHGFQIANAWPRIEKSLQPIDVWLATDALVQDSDGAHGSKIWLSVTVDGADSKKEVLHLLEASACTIVGVEIMDRTVGLLCLVGRALLPDSEDARLLELAARVAANMLDHTVNQTRLIETQKALKLANNELHRLSHFDALTGLANRRRFDDIKLIEFSRAVRSGLPLAVIMCDIDHFKLYNDSYGHSQGDNCLAAIGECLALLFVRAGEFPARLGGEEFVVLLPGATQELAMAQAERLRSAVWDLQLEHLASPVADRVTISVGLACLDTSIHADFDSLLLAADRALYCAKRERNSVFLGS